jgi:hypothetical protein
MFYIGQNNPKWCPILGIERDKMSTISGIFEEREYAWD